MLRLRRHVAVAWLSIAAEELTVPIVATIDGIKILFYHDEHPPAHFHARYAEHEAMIAIDSLLVLEGSLPAAQLRQVRKWARSRDVALRKAWMACRSDQSPERIV